MMAANYDGIVTVTGGIAEEAYGSVLLVDFDNAEQDPKYAREMAELLEYDAETATPEALAQTLRDLSTQLQGYWQ
jgi:hypothetical protein